MSDSVAADSVGIGAAAPNIRNDELAILHTKNGPKPSAFADTISALHLRVQRHDIARAGRRLSDAVVRGAAAGVALRGGLNLVSYVLNLALKSKRKRQQGQTLPPSLRELSQDALRWGAFLGTLSGVFVTADETIACLFGTKRTAAWRALLAGALAGPTILLTGRKTRHTSFALYVFLRGLALLVRCGNLPTAAPWKRTLLAPTRYRHGDVALMCLSTCQFGYSWILLPSTLPSSYVRFLNKHGGKDMWVLEAIREMCSRRIATGTTFDTNTSTLAALADTPHAHFNGKLPCEFLHPGTTCTGHTLSFLPAGYLRALPVYLPVYVIPAALVHRGRLLDPKTRMQLWTKIGMGALRSSAFLSLYCALAWRGACVGWNTAGYTSAAAIVSSCWIAGLSTFVEKKSRRMELALYCLSRSIEAFSLTMVAHGYLNPRWFPRRLDVMLFSAATAAVAHCYSDHFGERRDVFKSKYLVVFDFILGNCGFEQAGIRHAPSNGELLGALRRSMSNLAGFTSGRSERLSLSEQGYISSSSSSNDEDEDDDGNEDDDGKRGIGPVVLGRSSFDDPGITTDRVAESDGAAAGKGVVRKRAEL